MNREDLRKSVDAAMVKAQSEVERQGKDGYNEGQKYRYTEAKQIIQETRRVLLAAGIYVSTTVKSIEDLGEVGRQRIVRVWLEITYTHAESGAALIALYPGEGADIGDKALPKALTAALKYGLQQGLLVPCGDDPERDTERQPDQRGQRQPDRKPQQQQPPHRQPDRPALPAGMSKEARAAAELQGARLRSYGMPEPIAELGRSLANVDPATVTPATVVGIADALVDRLPIEGYLAALRDIARQIPTEFVSRGQVAPTRQTIERRLDSAIRDTRAPITPASVATAARQLVESLSQPMATSIARDVRNEA